MSEYGNQTAQPGQIEREAKEKFWSDVWDICRDTILMGQIAYWATAVVGTHNAIKVVETEYGEDWVESDGQSKMLTPSVIKAAAIKVSKGGVCNKQITKWIAGAIATNDAGDFDSTCADVVIQKAVLDELRYG